MKKKTMEQRTADTVLQLPDTVIVGDETFEVAPPSTATLILVSKETARLPQVRLNAEEIVSEALYIAKDCAVLGDILAVLILGAKGLRRTLRVKETRFFGLFDRMVDVELDRKAILAKRLLEEFSPKQLHDLAVGLLSKMQVADFFALTTSLIEVNLTRQTRGVVNETTASGR